MEALNYLCLPYIGSNTVVEHQMAYTGKRLFDLMASGLGLLLLSPLLLLIAVWIKLDSPGTVFFVQKRVGCKGRDFRLYKFRSMIRQEWESGLLITIGERDKRITTAGYFLRKYKLDELPQLFNVFVGDMSIVGPRPLVRQQTEIYPDAYREVLEVKPGITCRASILFSNEDELLGMANHPEEFFSEVLMPAKIRINVEDAKDQSFSADLRMICSTITKRNRQRLSQVLTAEEIALCHKYLDRFPENF
ncbi:probable sugar transferase [Porphyromonas crevioricanis JCM 13913]|nr:probable sugar transferase [Porphyromonas crevioricanis JCM 13913]